MTAWDYIAATNLSIAAFFLFIHAVMVGNPQYGWQPRSFLVRGGMIVLACYLFARSYTVFQGEVLTDLSQQIAAVMAWLFFLTWFDMVVTSWKRRMEEIRLEAEGQSEKATTVAIDRVSAEVHAVQDQSNANGAAIEQIRATVSILDPAPHEFKAAIGYKA